MAPQSDPKNQGFIQGFLASNKGLRQPPLWRLPWDSLKVLNDNVATLCGGIMAKSRKSQRLSAEVIDLKGFKWSDAQFSAAGVSLW